MSPRKKEENEKIREQSRRQILMSALEVFAEKGYANSSVSQIAKEAGISKGLIYHYFSSKEQVLKDIFNMMVEKGEEITGNWKYSDPKEMLRQMIHGSIAFIQHQNHIMRFLLSLAVQPAAIKDAEEFLEGERVRQVEKATQLFRDLGVEDPESEAYFFGAMLDGIAIGYTSLSKKYPLEALTSKILKHYNL